MSEGHFHVHGPHDHEVEHAAHSGDPFAGRIAVMTAIFATIGAFFGYMAGATQNDALLFKNEAAIRKTESSDQWNFYQAKSSKQNLAELGATLTTGEQQAKYAKEVERYKSEKERIVLRRPRHVAEKGADGREDRRHDGNAARERVAAVRSMFDFVIVRTVDVEMAFRHGDSFEFERGGEIARGQSRQREVRW